MEMVTLSLESYNKLRILAEGMDILNKSGDKFWISNTSTHYSGYYNYLTIISKDDAIKILQEQSKEWECRYKEMENHVTKMKYHYANLPWYKKIFSRKPL